MRKVIFVAPAPSGTTLRFARGAGALEQVEVLGVIQHPPADRSVFRDWALVPDASDPAHIQRGVQSLMQRHGRPHRLLAVLEQIQSEVAWVREQLQIPGQSLAVAQRMRDKGLMKQALEQAGLPCARYARLRGVQDALRFIHQVGFPIIPASAGAGCKATWRVENPAQLEEAWPMCAPARQNEVLAEEFLRGREYSFETVTVGGQPSFSSISRYLVTPLEPGRTTGFSGLHAPKGHLRTGVPRRAPGGVRAVKAMGFQDGITHMEWFRRPDQSVAIGEIAAGLLGADRANELVHDIDMSHIWPARPSTAPLMVPGSASTPSGRLSSAGWDGVASWM